MARVFISGSSTGLGLMAGQWLADRGHEVVLHGRNARRSDDARRALPSAHAVVTGDLGTIAAIGDVADQVNGIGGIDAVIHNAAVGYQEAHSVTADGLPHLFVVNTLAPYMLTALIRKPARLVYMSSGMHRSAHAHLDDLLWRTRPWRGATAYAESKLHDAMLAFAVARKWPDVVASAVEPGWVATRMGGPAAPDDLSKGAVTQAWLAAGDDEHTRRSGAYWFHQQMQPANTEAHDEGLQERLLDALKRVSGVALPG